MNNSINTHLRLKIPSHTTRTFNPKKELIAFTKPSLRYIFIFYLLIDNFDYDNWNIRIKLFLCSSENPLHSYSKIQERAFVYF
jgi:hypothetical protein